MIARNELPSNLLKHIDELIAKMPYNEFNYANVYEYALWADDVKFRDYYRNLDEWHFYDQPICDGIDPKKIKLVLDPKFGVVNSVIEGLKTLKFHGPYPSSFDGIFEKSFMLRFFIHLVGDMHQPLHMSTRCTPELPECDAGGNKFTLKGTPSELHALWDQCLNFLKPDGSRV